MDETNGTDGAKRADGPGPGAGARNAIEVEHLECGYDGQTILKDVTFAVRTGEIFFVIGGSGCGKTTLLRNMIGIHPPTAGAVKFFGDSFTQADMAHRRELLKRFGVLYQGGALWTSLTLRQNVELPLEEYTTLSKREREEIATLKLAQVGLTGSEDYYPAEVSGGMKKRAGLARALALDPAILFLDEPSAGLDPITSRRLDELVLQIREMFGTTMVVVSHELASIFSIADRVILLDRGEQGIIAEGKAAELARTSRDPRVTEFLHRGGAREEAK
ncbi:MAG TPA: ATP-binding cassette domain-containing protein [Opitutus sp.]|nr:ATP-binding cassette domain-containing protein [Opitutus sp.]